MEMAVGLKSILLGETTLAGLRRQKARAEREASVAKTAAQQAHASFDALIEDGADDEALRAAVDRKTVSSWAVARATKKLAAIDVSLREAEAKDRASRLDGFMRAAVETATAHGAAAETARATAASHMQAISALQENGFASEAAAFGQFPPTVIDYSSAFSANPGKATHDGLDRWRWSIAQLKTSLEKAA